MTSPISWWKGFLALPNDHLTKTLGVAFLVALICSVLVSATAVMLKPLHEANRLGHGAAHIRAIVEGLGEKTPSPRLVDLATGAYVEHDPNTRTELPRDRDIARLGSREDVATVFELREGGKLKLVIVPVRGSGYQSTLKGYLALQADLNTVAALTFYEHDETPGLGSLIDEDAWKALWPGKQLSDGSGTIQIEVVKGAGAGVHEVDGISGATRTGTGVTRLMHFWLGPDGYGPYLARLQAEASQ
jgi:Na+-transporting NADH:ubiquinone oxidoreductase subunit C